jgi:SAM-dependent methyltransferase
MRVSPEEALITENVVTGNDTTMKNLFAEARLVTNLEDCLFYHTMDIPGYGTVPGFWDLRGRESQYFGEVAFENKRVLEIGPASGHLSFYMERQGAEIISIEPARDHAWDFYWDIPENAPASLAVTLKNFVKINEEFKNSYWLAHRAFSSNARVHYGDAGAIPAELGTFDISTLACVLLHNKNPLRILESCARITRETLIIVEPFREMQLSQSPVEFLPTSDENWWDTWWGFSPGFFVRALRTMGFPHSKVTFHRQIQFDLPEDLFTVVATRVCPEGFSGEKESAVEMRCPVTGLRLDAGDLLRIPISIRNIGDAPLSSFSLHPALLSYRWRLNTGEILIRDGLRTSLPRTLYRGDRENLLISVRAPAEAGLYSLEITLVEEHLRWHEDESAGLPIRIETLVRPAR